jgi:hypothetical protein
MSTLPADYTHPTVRAVAELIRSMQVLTESLALAVDERDRARSELAAIRTSPPFPIPDDWEATPIDGGGFRLRKVGAS